MNESILVVDDSAFNCRYLGGILRADDYRVFEASTGGDAIRMVRDLEPDLVLLDVMMPDVHGFEVLHRLKSDIETSETPVILVSSLEDSATKVKGLDLGADDYITKPFDRGEILARVRAHLRIRQLNRCLVEKQALLDQDLAAAAEIQRNLMPPSMGEFLRLKTVSHFEPCEQIGGDIFNVVRLDEDHVAFFVVDVSGHGVPAAMITVAVVQSLSLTAGIVIAFDNERRRYRIRPPKAVLAELEKLFPFERFSKHFTIAYAVLDVGRGRLSYSSAGHPPPVLQARDGPARLLEAGGPVIGLGEMLAHGEGEVDLEPGDRVYLYTDGLIERRNGGRQIFGMEGMLRALADARGSSLEDVCARLLSDVRNHDNGAGFRDDISLLAFELLDGHPADVEADRPSPQET